MWALKFGTKPKSRNFKKLQDGATIVKIRKDGEKILVAPPDVFEFCVNVNFYSPWDKVIDGMGGDASYSLRRFIFLNLIRCGLKVGRVNISPY